MDQEFQDKFWKQVETQDNGCWIWVGPRHVQCDNPWGRFHYKDRAYAPHRVSYELAIGELPEGAHVFRSCGNRLCVFPGHLYTSALPGRFWRNVEKHDDGCWLWTAARTKAGYGVFGSGDKVIYAHRYSYQLSNGEPIPKGLHVRHKCDNPACVNPGHLELGTPLENTRDTIDRNRNCYGVRVWTAKLDDDKVREIRRRYSDGDETQRELAEEFGVCRTTVGHLVNGKTWKHVSPVIDLVEIERAA